MGAEQKNSRSVGAESMLFNDRLNDVPNLGELNARLADSNRLIQRPSGDSD